MKKLSALALVLLLALPSFSLVASAEEAVKISIICAYASEKPHGDYVYSYADAFMEANPGVEIEITAMNSNDVYTKLVTLASSSDLPTLFYTSADQAPSLYDLGICDDWAKYLSADVLAAFAPGVIDNCMLEGAIAYYPIDLQPNAILYRTDRFEAAGLQVPKTWDEFLACAKALTNDNEKGFSMVGTNNSSGHGRFLYYLWSQGLEVVKQEDGKWVTDLDSEQFLNAFTFWTDMNNVEHVVPDGITECAYNVAANYFAMGQTSMMMSGGNALGVSYDTNPDLMGKIGTFPIPGDFPGTMLNSEGYALAMNASEEEKKTAAAFVEFFTNNDPDMNFWKLSGKLPSTTEGLASEYLQGLDYAGFVEAVTKYHPLVTFPGLAALKGLLGDAYSAVFSGEMTNEQTVAKMLSEVEELLDEYN